MKPLKTSYAVGEKDFDLIEKTIGTVFDEIVHKYGERDGLIFDHEGVRWTFSEYNHQINLFAASLMKLGVKRGDRVGIWAPNCHEWCLTQFATAKIGAIMVCLNPAYRLTEIEYALKKSGCSIIVTAEKFKSSDYVIMLQTLIPELDNDTPGKIDSAKFPLLKTIIRTGEGYTPGMLNFSTVIASATPHDVTKVIERQKTTLPSDPINIQFTSGTTGAPKGATLTHKNILNNGFVIGEGMALTEHDRLCIPVPLYHCFGMVLGNLAALTHGTAAIFPGESFEPLATLETVEREKCTALHGVPTMFIAELEHPEFDLFDLSSLRTGIMAGALCPEAIMKRVLNDMHMEEILIAYGQTECSPVNHMTHATDPLDKRVSTVGRAGPHLQIKITDENGTIVPVNTPGEICCSGYAVMVGYWENEVGTNLAIDNEGWLHSGDIGIMDSEGYVQITGRIKDMIIRGGENVYPKEIEDYLFDHPAIEDVQIFGIPDEEYGEQVCAWVKLRQDETLSEHDIKAYCQGQIAHFKVPSLVRFVDEFPMTVTGKIQKFIMRDTEVQE